MKLAETLAKDNTACPSRQCAAVIVDEENRIVSLGYNGPPKGIPHCDTKEFREQYLFTKLDILDMEELEFLSDDDFKGKCPRKLLGYKSGEADHYCACLHAEQNAILNAGRHLDNCHLFIYGGFPCDKCAAQIVQVGIKYVYYIGEGYPQTASALWMFERGGVHLVKYGKN